MRAYLRMGTSQCMTAVRAFSVGFVGLEWGGGIRDERCRHETYIDRHRETDRRTVSQSKIRWSDRQTNG